MSDSTSAFPPPPEPERRPSSPSGPTGGPTWEQGPPPPAGYGYGATAAPGYGQPAGVEPPYANWLYRVGSYLIDGLLHGVPASIGSAIYNASITRTVVNDRVVETSGPSAAATIILVLLSLLSIGIFVWNTCLRQGRTGQSVGKGIVGTRLVSASTGQPIGGGLAFVRYLCHILDALPCYVGFLWPLWDRQRQTFADKIVGTYVVKV
jgi:uncharacterized RDD family membrane protein YckC